MSRVEHYSMLRQGVRGDGVQLADRLARARETAGGKPSHPRRDDRDRREPPPRIRHQLRGAGRLRARVPPQSGPGPGGGTVQVRDRARRGDRTPRRGHGRRRRRAHPAGCFRRGTRQLRPILRVSDPDATVTAGNASGSERRRRRVCRYLDAGGGATRADPTATAQELGGHRRWAAADGYRAGPGVGTGARAGRADVGGSRPDRAQRGVRRPGAGRVDRAGDQARTTSG